MIALAMFSAAVGIVFGGAVVFGTISWIKEHVSTYEDSSGKYGILTTNRVLFSVKLRDRVMTREERMGEEIGNYVLYIVTGRQEFLDKVKESVKVSGADLCDLEAAALHVVNGRV